MQTPQQNQTKESIRASENQVDGICISQTSSQETFSKHVGDKFESQKLANRFDDHLKVPVKKFNILDPNLQKQSPNGILETTPNKRSSRRASPSKVQHQKITEFGA